MLQQLSGLDTLFLYVETPHSRMEIGALLIYDPSTAPGGRVGFDEILATFGARLDRSRTFRRKLKEVPLSLDYPYWVDAPDFDINRHVRRLCLPRPGSWEQLMAEVARLQVRPLDRGRPLWEAWMIEGLGRIDGLAEGCFGMFLKMHHVSVDGASGHDLLRAIHDVHPAGASEPDTTDRRMGRPATPGALNMLFRTPLNYASNYARLVYDCAALMPGLLKSGLSGLTPARREVPDTLFNRGLPSGRRVMDGRFFDLAEWKRVARKCGDTSVNDVALTVVGGAMREYLEARGDLPRAPLVASCPVNLRSGDGRDERANAVSAITVSLCSDIADPVERMRAVHDSTVAAKSRLGALGEVNVMEFPMKLPAPVARNLMWSAGKLQSLAGLKPYNTLVTNVVGIQQPIYFAGARMVRQMGTGPVVDWSGLIHYVFSYDGMISIAFTACEGMLPDPAVYAGCIEDAYAELRSSVSTARR